MIPRITLDASVALAWFLPDTSERLQYAQAVHDALRSEQLFAVVPTLFYAETAKGLRLAVHRRAMSKVEASQAAGYIDQLIGQCVAEPSSIQRIVDLSMRHQIQAYDSTYLMVALAKGGKAIATLDGGVAAGARALGVAHWTPDAIPHP